MKAKSFLFLLLLLVTFSGLSAQKQKADTIPSTVISAFEREYPEAKVKDWSLKGDKYIANAKIDGQMAQAYFTVSGSWIETVYNINEKEMPGRIDNYLTSNYPQSVLVTSQYKENKNNGAFYFIQIKKNKSSQEIDADLFFDVSGNFQTKTEYHPLTEALSSSTKQEAEKKAKAEAEKADYEARRSALLKMDRSVKDSELPAKVKVNFRKKFPKALETRWDSLDNVFTAYYIDNEMPVKSNWSLSGDWLSTIETLPNGPIFRPVDIYLEQNYASNIISLAQRITSRDKNSGFYVEVHPKVKKGVTPSITKIHFDKSGRFIKAEEPEKIAETASAETEETPENVSDEPDAFENKLSKEDQKGETATTDVTALKVSAKELPSKALTYINENYPEYKVKEAYFSDYDDLGNCYKVTIRKEGVSQKPSDMYFSDHGVLLREDNPPPKKSELEAEKKEKESPKVSAKKPVEEEVTAEEQEEPDTEEADVSGDPEDIELADVPDLVKKNFSKRYPRAMEPLWKTRDNKYYVEFYFNEIKNILEFTPDGVIQVTRTETDPNMLFGPIKRYLEDNHKAYKVRYAEKIVRKDRKNYFYVEIFTKKRNVNPQEMQLYFDKVGKVMQNPPE
ncbi:MAG: PepSY-like domain-containing protein [Bacteroidales bacterium]